MQPNSKKMNVSRIMLAMILSLVITLGNAQIQSGFDNLPMCKNCLIEKNLYHQYSIESIASDNELVFKRSTKTQINSQGKPTSISNFDEENNLELTTQYFYNEEFELIRKVENWTQLSTVKITTIQYDRKRNIQTEESVKRMKSDTTVYTNYQSVKTISLNDKGKIISSTNVTNGETTISKHVYNKENLLSKIEYHTKSDSTITEYQYGENDRIILIESKNLTNKTTHRTQYDYVEDTIYFISYFQNEELTHKDKHIANKKSKFIESIVEEPHLNRKRIYRTKIGSV